jgi:hypothetical protein
METVVGRECVAYWPDEKDGQQPNEKRSDRNKN